MVFVHVTFPTTRIVASPSLMAFELDAINLHLVKIGFSFGSGTHGEGGWVGKFFPDAMETKSIFSVLKRIFERAIHSNSSILEYIMTQNNERRPRTKKKITNLFSPHILKF